MLARGAGWILTLWLAYTITFCALAAIPGDPAGALLAPNAPPEHVAAERHALGLDDPLYLRYLHALGALARGDLGPSWATRRPVALMLAENVPATLQLASAAVTLSLILGLTLGLLALRTPYLLNFTTLWIAAPIPVTGVLALGLLGTRLDTSILLPTLVLGLPLAGALARVTHTQVRTQLTAEYVRTAHAKGLAPNARLLVHVLPNALPAVLSTAGLQAGVLLGGTVLTEAVFSRAGLGRLLIDAILHQDLPVVQGAVLYTTLGYILVNGLVDFLHARLDPRLRVSPEQQGGR